MISVELDDEETAALNHLVEKYSVTVEALLTAALRAGLDVPDAALVRLGVYDPRRASPMLNPSAQPSEDDYPF